MEKREYVKAKILIKLKSPCKKDQGIFYLKWERNEMRIILYMPVTGK